jgi:hypothetical protein
MDKIAENKVETVNAAPLTKESSGKLLEEYCHSRAAETLTTSDMRQTSARTHTYLPTCEIVGQQSPSLCDRSAAQAIDNQAIQKAKFGSVADSNAKSSDQSPRPQYDSRQQLTEAWGYGSDGSVYHFVKVGTKDGKPIWVVDSNNRTREQVEKAYRLNQAQIDRGMPAVAAREKGMLGTVGVQIDVSVSGDSKLITVKSAINGRTAISEFPTAKDRSRAENGIQYDESGKPKVIECKNANGKSESFKRVGKTDDGRELWSINGGAVVPMKVEQAKNGQIMISCESGNLHVIHEIRNGVRTSKTSRH